MMEGPSHSSAQLKLTLRAALGAVALEGLPLGHGGRAAPRSLGVAGNKAPHFFKLCLWVGKPGRCPMACRVSEWNQTIPEGQGPSGLGWWVWEQLGAGTWDSGHEECSRGMPEVCRQEAPHSHGSQIRAQG